MLVNKKTIIAIVVIFILGVGVVIGIHLRNKKIEEDRIAYLKFLEKKKQDSIDALIFCVDSAHCYFMDINVKDLHVEEKEIDKNTRLQYLFNEYGFTKKDYQQFNKRLVKFNDNFYLKSKQRYYVLSNHKDTLSIVNYFIFEISKKEYLIVDCTDSFKLRNFSKQIDTLEHQLAFVVTKSINKYIKANEIHKDLVDEIDQSFQNKFSTSQLRKGDTVRLIYEEYYIEGEPFKIGDIRSAQIITKKQNYFVTDYFMTDDSSHLYVDEKGKYTKITFLKSPIQKGGRVASRFNLERFHPVLLEVRPHLGTDFAAPQGTPIIATASGVVVAASFSENNGNFIKIKHNRTYTTQYLHMSKFATTIREGVWVRQGQVIGYVGSTGLATGPHVCYRFWKNGVQVDPFRERTTSVGYIPKNEKDKFNQLVVVTKERLNKIKLL